MNHSYWLIVVFVATIVCNTNSRPQDNNVKNIYPVYRPSKELDLNKSNSFDVPVTQPTTTATELPTTAKIQDGEKATKEKPSIESIATVARASSDGPSLSPSLAKVADQLRDTVGQMVDSDTRTPPKLKEIIKEKKDNNESKVETQSKEATTQASVTVRNEMLVDKIEANGKFELPDANERPTSLSMDSSEGKASNSKKKEEEGTKGIAVPVIMDDVDAEPLSTPPKKMQKIPEVPKPAKEEKKKVTAKPTKENPTTTPSSGLSTWILLSDNREATTPSIKKNNNKDDKKRVTTTKKPSKIQTTTVKPTTSKPNTKQTSKKNSSNKTSSGNKKEENVGMSALEEMVKNQKKNPATTVKSVSSVKKPVNDSKKKPDKISERIDEAETKDKVEIELSDGKKTVTLPPMLHVTENPTTLSVTDSSDAAATTENPQESTTEKRKRNKNKKKKNKNKSKKKNSNKNATDVELKNNNSKNPKQPVGAQLYNFLSREIMPTVGLGLVGVLVTAGLAGLLGYNPFQGNLPIRRTYESQHGYSPNYYYNYNTDYNDGGQSEEVLFREVLSGMPEESRYGLTTNDSAPAVKEHSAYAESQLYRSQEQVYDNMKNPVDAAYPNADESSYSTWQDSNYEKEPTNYDSTYQQDYSNVYGSAYNANTKYSTDVQDKDDKYPMYDRETGTSYVYPETEGEKSSRITDEYSGDGTKYGQYSVGAEALKDDSNSKHGNEKLSAKYSKVKTETIEKQPEALYRVAGESDYPYKISESTVQGVGSQNNWHRIGSPMDYRQLPYLEPGPRSLKLNKEEKKVEIITKNDQAKKRAKRDADSVIQRIGRKRTNRNNENPDFENEIDFEDSVNIDNLIKKHQELSPTENASNESILSSTESTTTTESSFSSSETSTENSEEMTTKLDMTTESSTGSSSVTTEDVKEVTQKFPSSHETPENNDVNSSQNQLSFLDVLKRLAQFKLKLGLNFLKSATDAFSNYLVDIQKKVDESFLNNTKSYYNLGRNPWARSLFRKRSGGEETTKERSKRSVLDDNEFLGLNLRKNDKSNDRFLRENKKETKTIKPSQSKKKTLKRYKSKKV